jgi:hypothetical protein
MITIDLDPLYDELVSAERFLEMYESERDSIESARPVPEPLGSKILGRILVRRNKPIYTAVFADSLST